MDATKEQAAFNLQVRIPDELKQELRMLAAQIGVYPKVLVQEALAHYLPIKRKELAKANGRKK